VSVFMAISNLLETILSITVPAVCVIISHNALGRKEHHSAYWWLGLAATMILLKK
jgi:hypothetical protein